MLRSDLRALRNLFATRPGRQLLVAQAVVLACIAAGSLGLVGLLLTQRPVRDAIRANLDGDVVRILHSLILALPLLFVLLAGTRSLKGELYTAAHVPGLLAAPVSSRALVVRAFARTLFGWALFTIAFVVPPTLRLCDGLPWAASPALVVAVVAAALSLLTPLLAVQLLVKVAAVRWLSGARLRRFVTLAQVVVFVAVSLALVMGFVRHDDVARVLAAWLGDRAGTPSPPFLSWLLGAPAALPAAAAGYPQGLPRLLAPLLLAALAVPPILLAASIYRTSYEVHATASPLEWAARTRSRTWPTAPLSSIVARMRVETVRVGANLGFYAFLATVLVVLLSRGVEARAHEAHAPTWLLQWSFLLSTWQGMTLLVASILFLAVVGSEQAQIPLLASSPVSRRTLLLGKLISLSWPFLAMLAVTAFAGPLAGGTGIAAVGAFALTAPAILLFVLGVLAAAGTWPRFVRIHDDVPIASSLRVIVPVITVGVVCGATLFGTSRARAALVAAAYGHGPFAGLDLGLSFAGLVVGAWLAGGLVLLGGCWLAARNLERLLGPQDD
jgi:hypothetical protein